MILHLFKVSYINYVNESCSVNIITETDHLTPDLINNIIPTICENYKQKSIILTSIEYIDGDCIIDNSIKGNLMNKLLTEMENNDVG